MSSSHGKVKLNTERLPEINETAIRMVMPTKMKQAEQGSECTLDLETNAPSVVSLSRLYLLLPFLCYSQEILFEPQDIDTHGHPALQNSLAAQITHTCCRKDLFVDKAMVTCLLSSNFNVHSLFSIVSAGAAPRNH